MESAEVLIIGAGISGLLSATELTKSRHSVLVLDKGRGYGGRMATRRMAGTRLDHGAQYFTVRDKRFQSYVDEWLAAGIVQEWFRHLPKDRNPGGYPRYCGIEGMTDAPKYLARKLDIRRSEQVAKLERDGKRWIAHSQSGNTFAGEHLLLTAPLPQALALLDTSGLDYAGSASRDLRQVRYEKGLATLAILDGPSGLPSPGCLPLDEAPLTWIGDNTSKGISPDVSAITIHADAAFAQEHWDSPDEERGTLMLEAARKHLASSVTEYACHRWGFATPVNPWPEPCFANPTLNLALAGDAFGGPRIEGAALSGIEAGQAISAQILANAKTTP